MPTGEPTPTDSGDSGTTDTGTLPEIDCSVLPYVPVTWQTFTQFGRAEDFDFDADGYMVAVFSGNLVGKNQLDEVKVIAAGVGNIPAGTRILATGDFVIARTGMGTLVLIDTASGSATTIYSGLQYPNGVEVDALNNVYTADQNLGKVIRVNAYDPTDNEVVAEGLVSPNGVILSPDEQTLYVGSFGGGVIYAVERDPAGGWMAPTELFRNPGYDGGFDGINVDICGNIYFTEYIAGKVWRITPDGQQGDLVADLPSGWIPNMRWGNDIGGWSSEVLYVSDRDGGRLFGLEIGIPGKRHILMP